MDFKTIDYSLKQEKGKFKFRGWIKRKRVFGEKIFILLRDTTNEMQCVFAKADLKNEIWAKVDQATIESSVSISGSLKEDKRAPNGFELVASEIEVISLSAEFPIQRDLSESFILDVRHLWMRSSKMTDALKVKATVLEAFRDFMKEKNVTEVQGPMFVTGAVEGGSTLFEVPYFGKKAFLTQSSQFYLETFIFSHGDVYTIAPSFRAEKSRTRRHVTEFWHAEGEFAWMGLPELLDFEEGMVKFIAKKVIENNEQELKSLGRDPKELEPTIKKKWPRFTYNEILKDAQKKFPKLKHGSDFGEKEEREITKDFKTPIIVTHYPAKLKPFYHRPDPENPEYLLCNDVLAPEGYGEIIGSGERCWNMDEILSRMKAQHIDPKPYQWYIDLRKYGGVQHSGFGLGIERLTTWLCKLDHIKDVIAYPRTMNRLYP